MISRSAGGIAYEERGEGYPFIALHGFSLDRRMSIGAFEPLFGASNHTSGRESRAYRRIYPDLPFMGESTDEPGSEGHDGILAALCDFILEAVPNGPFLLAGESYGGYLARGLARAFGARVAGLFFLCPAIVGRRNARSLPAAAVLREDPCWRGQALAEGADEAALSAYECFAVERSLAGFRRFRDEILAGIRLTRYSALEGYYRGAQEFTFDSLGPADGPGEPFDALFDGPACFFLGRQDISVGWRDAFRLADRYPRASYHVVDVAGHNAQLERPDLFAAAFGAWIADCESSGADRTPVDAPP